VRATKLLKSMHFSKKRDDVAYLASNLWEEYGLLCLSMLSEPIRGGALQSKMHTAKMAWMTRWAQQTASKEAPRLSTGMDEMRHIQKYVLGIASFCFLKAAKMCPENWMYPFRAAHCYYKLEKSPEVILIRLFDRVYWT
jgi:hypothetical protein